MTTVEELGAKVSGAAAVAPRGAIPWLLITLGAATWVLTLRPVAPSDLTDIGLLPALPRGWWLGVFLASFGLVASIFSRPVDVRAGSAAVVLLAAILYATPAIVEPLPRFNTVYVHLGFVEAIERTGRLFPDLDARFSWPVFFTAMTAVSAITGIRLIEVAAWVPFFSTMVVLPAAWLLSRAFTDDTRLSLLMLWVLVLANWVGQDYLSPQGFNFALYVWLLALVAWAFGSTRPQLTWIRSRLRRPVRAEPTTVGIPAAGPWVHASLVVIVGILAMVSVTSHQLTPFAMIAASGLLVLFSRTTLRWLPVLIAIMTVVWVTFAGYSFLAGHLEPLLREIGNPVGATQTGVVSRLRGSEGHTFVVTERIVFSLAFWGLAGLGVLRRWWEGHWDIAAVLLAGFPFGLIAMQSYGGEIFLRVYLIALPAMAFLAAAAIRPGGRVPRWVLGPALVAFSMAMTGGFIVARYGNELADIVTPGELAAVDEMHALAAPGSVMATINYNSPIRYRDVERYDFFDIPSTATALTKLDVVTLMSNYAQGRPTLLLVSRGQLALERLNGVTEAEIGAFLTALEANPGLTIAFQNDDATVFRLVGGAAP